MDYTGLGKFNRFKVDRPLTDDEITSRFNQKQSSSSEPNHYLSVIRVNSTCLELVDRWYPGKGFSSWVGAFGMALVLALLAFFFRLVFFDEDFLKSGETGVRWFVLLVLFPLGLAALAGALYGFLLENFRYTHYPMLLNRRTRKVHVFRQDATVLTANWDDLFVTLAESSVPLLGKTHDVRAHVLAEDGITVKESFSLGYTWPEKPDSMHRMWEFIRRYMEEPDGVRKTHDQVEFCLPIHDRKEGFAFGVMRTFAPGGHWPILQLLFCMPFSLNALGRWVAMSSSKIPRWPADVEADNAVAADDPYRKDWHKNPAPNFQEKGWPIICCLVGWAAITYVIWWLISA